LVGAFILSSVKHIVENMKKTVRFFQKPIFVDKRFVITVWFVVPLIAGIKHAVHGLFNDYVIFKSVFYHTIEQVNLYLPYPELKGDSNHYGPVFSLVFAPFALLPDSIGTILWELSMAGVLFWAIYKLPIKWEAKAIICYLSLQTLFANAVNSETNTLIAALIIGSFVCIRSEKDFWAGCFIALGLFIKLYGIVGLAFFFFSKNKFKLIGSLFFWSVVFFVLPMIISSPQFIIQSYFDWYESLVTKNGLNIFSYNQDMSVMGMIRRISGNFDISNLPILSGGIFLFALQYLNIKSYNNLRYQLGLLASTLLFVVLFSTGTEPCTFIISMCGVSIWFILQKTPYNKAILFLIVLVLLTTLLTSGLAPAFIRKDIIKAYGLSALPYFLVWLLLLYQIITFNKSDRKHITDKYLLDS